MSSQHGFVDTPAQLRQFLNLLPSSEDESRFSKDLPLEVNNNTPTLYNSELTPPI